VSDKFVRERHLAGLLMQRLGIGVTEYLDPNAPPRQESGVDVLAITTVGRIGDQSGAG
jgi:hypothetical protein